ncbi:MAG: hypothetical protein ABEI98_01595 [Halorhabdus sp.]
MATIERCEVTTVGPRLVYGLDRDSTGTGDRRVCFRRSDDVLVSAGEVVTIEYGYEQPGRERLPRMLVDVTVVRILSQ